MHAAGEWCVAAEGAVGCMAHEDDDVFVHASGCPGVDNAVDVAGREAHGGEVSSGVDALAEGVTPAAVNRNTGDGGGAGAGGLGVATHKATGGEANGVAHNGVGAADGGDDDAVVGLLGEAGEEVIVEVGVVVDWGHTGIRLVDEC